MTKMNELALAIFLCTIVSCHCTNIKPKNNNTNSIEQTCKQTPNYALCIRYLKSDPINSDAALIDQARFLVDRIRTSATTALKRVRQLIGFGGIYGSPYQQEALNSCAGRYRSILDDVVPKSITALEQGDPKVAEDGANDAANEATTCENGFKGMSPMSDENMDMHDLAVITAAIIKQLL